MNNLINYLKTERGKKIGIGAFLCGFSALFTFAGYELIRSPSESIFLSYFQAQQKTYTLSLSPLFIFIFIYLYGIALSRYGSMKAMAISFIFTFINLSFFYFILLYYPNKYLAFLFLIFKESYVVIISEQYWSYINSILKNEEGKIFNGPIAGLGALGPLLGGWLISKAHFKTETFILFSILCLLPALILFIMAYKDTGEPIPSKDEESGQKGHLHLSILKENKIVLSIAIMVFLTQIIATLFDVNFTSYVQKNFADKDLRTAFLGDFWMKVNIVSFSMQFIFTPIILKKFKEKTILTIIPFIHIFTSIYLLINSNIFSASLAFLLFKSMDYSIFRAAKEILYIPFSYDTRYRAKQVADAFTYRFSKGFTSVILSIGNIFLKTSISVFPLFTLIFSGIWAMVAFNINRGSED